MNWTGGTLQRRSKANANPAVRSRKRYLAKARYQVPKQSNYPPSSPILSILQGATAYETKNGISATNEIESPTVRNPIRAARDKQHRDNTRVASSANIRTEQRQSRQSETHLQSPVSKTNIHQPARTIDEARNLLLERSDWTELAAVKPVKIDFTSAEEMERFGRQQKVRSSKGTPRQNIGSDHNNSYKIRKLIKKHLIPSDQKSPRLENVSFKIESDIPSPQMRRHSSVAATISTDSMLLDKHEEQYSQKLQHAVEADELSTSRAHDSSSIHQPLTSLENIRGLRSFDQVGVHSKSISTQPSAKSDQPVQENEKATHSVNSPDIWAEGQEVYKHDFASLSRQASDNYSFRERPKFTLDEQVELETAIVLPEVDNQSARLRTSSCSNLETEVSQALGSAVASKLESNRNHRFDTLRRPSSNDGKEFRQPSIPQHDVRPAMPSDSSRVHDNHDVIWNMQSGYMSHGRQLLSRGSNSRPHFHGNPASNMRQRFVRAKEEQVVPSSNRQYVGRSRVSDDNEAWMQFVFPKDFERIRNSFTFGISPARSPAISPSLTSDRDGHYTNSSFLTSGCYINPTIKALPLIRRPTRSSHYIANSSPYTPSRPELVSPSERVSRNRLLTRSVVRKMMSAPIRDDISDMSNNISSFGTISSTQPRTFDHRLRDKLPYEINSLKRDFDQISGERPINRSKDDYLKSISPMFSTVRPNAGRISTMRDTGQGNVGYRTARVDVQSSIFGLPTSSTKRHKTAYADERFHPPEQPAFSSSSFSSSFFSPETCSERSSFFHKPTAETSFKIRGLSDLSQSQYLQQSDPFVWAPFGGHSRNGQAQS